jgi:hypothetical protein
VSVSGHGGTQRGEANGQYHDYPSDEVNVFAWLQMEGAGVLER